MTQTVTYTELNHKIFLNLSPTSYSKNIQKHHFTVSNQLGDYFTSSVQDYQEEFYDTSNWDLAKKGFWWKRVTDVDGKILHKLKVILPAR